MPIVITITANIFFRQFTNQWQQLLEQAFLSYYPIPTSHLYLNINLVLLCTNYFFQIKIKQT